MLNAASIYSPWLGVEKIGLVGAWRRDLETKVFGVVFYFIFFYFTSWERNVGVCEKGGMT